MNPYIKVQSGETTLTGVTSVDVDITAVDLSRAFIIVYVRGEGTTNAQDFDEIYCTAEFLDADTIRITRYESGGEECNVTWQVVEADGDAPTPAFEVQTGEVAFGSGDSDLTDSITDISDTTNAIIVTNARFAASNDDNERIQFRGTFDDSSTVRLRRGATGSAVVVRYWVVKFSSDFTVRKGSVAMTGSTANDTFTAVTTSRSMLFVDYDASSGGIAQTAVKAHLASSTQINFERETSTGSCNIEYAVVEFPSDCVGQSDATAWGDTNYSATSSISAVTLANTIITKTNECTGTGTAQPRGISTIRFSSTTEITMQRSYNNQTHTVSWTLIDTSAWTYSPGDTYVIQKTLAYEVVSSSAITKGLTYTVLASVSPIQKALTYAVAATVAAITKGLEYVIDQDIYSRQTSASLPTGTDNLTTVYSAGEKTNVATDDDTRVNQVGVDAEYVIHQFKKTHANNTDAITPTFQGQVPVAPSSKTVYLQIYDHNLGAWETIDSDNTSAAGVDFELSATVEGSDYFGTNNVVVCRVYQDA